MTSVLTKYQELMIDGMAASLKEQQAKGRTPYGFVKECVEALKAAGIDWDDAKLHTTLNNRCRSLKAKEAKRAKTVPDAILLNDESAGSDLTEPISVGDSPPSLPTAPVSVAETAPETVSTKKNGRPLGSTNQAKFEQKHLLILACNKVAKAYKKVMEDCRAAGIRVPKGCMDSIISETKVELGLPEELQLNKHTLRNRTRQDAKSLSPKHRGTVSPLAAIEPVVVATIMQMAKINHPMDKDEVLMYINTMIEGTVFEDRLLDFKGIIKSSQRDELLRKVGSGYYQRFLKRHSHLLESKKARRFALDRSEWMRPEYIQRMYEKIYNIWVEAGVATRLESPVAYNKEGAVVPIGCPEQYGRISDLHIPLENRDFILFMDETGINTCQRDDGQEGGKRYLVPDGTVPLLKANMSNHRATVLPIVSAAGRLVAVVVIFMSDRKEVDASWAAGYDITVDPILLPNGQIDYANRDNYGPGKVFPSGPECDYMGKKIPCMYFCSPKGSITGDILVKILKNLDALKLFDRTPGAPKPCFVVDGHESRLMPTFLSYINDPAHMWYVGLGVPYLTHLWQVGDASELNGSFKIQWMKAKSALMDFKGSYLMKQRLYVEDIIPCLNKAVSLSFGKSASNISAIAERGWYPPTKKILDNPKLRDLEDIAAEQSSSVNSASVLDSVVLSVGQCAVVMDKIIQHSDKKQGIARRDEAIRNGKKMEDLFGSNRKVTSGLMIKNDVYCLNDPGLLQGFNEREKKKLQEAKDKEDKDRKKKLQLKEKIDAIRIARGADFLNWKMAELKMFLQYKKGSKEKGAMPKLLPDLQKRAQEWQADPLRASPIPSPVSTPCHSDDEGDIDLCPLDEVSITSGMNESQLI